MCLRLAPNGRSEGKAVEASPVLNVKGRAESSEVQIR